MKTIKITTYSLIAILLIVSDYRFSYLNNIRMSLGAIVTPIYFTVDFPQQVYTWINEQGETQGYLLKKNERLSNEIITLKVKIQKYNALLLENKKLSELLGAKYKVQDQQTMLARVIDINQSRFNKQITINKGSLNGLNIGQVALGVNGVVGQITQITPLYSVILIITDPTQYIPVKNKRNGLRGMSKGGSSKQNSMQVNFIENNADIRYGDIFISSAIGSKFPSGYPVGRVIEVANSKNSPFAQVKLVPIQDFNKLEFVLMLIDSDVEL